MNNKPQQILYMVQLPRRVSPGQRFRFELYEQLLHENGFKVTTKSFLDEKAYAVLYQPGHYVQKTWGVLKGFYRRFALIFSIRKYDYILMQREAAPVGPPVFEWIYIKVLGCRVIYDFDDAIWLPNISDQNKLAKFFKFFGKIKTICRWSEKVSAGNQFLCDFAKQYNANVVYNPTCVDTERQHNIPAIHDVDRVTVVWTGSFSTLKYLSLVEGALQRLQEKYDFDIKVICNQAPALRLKNLQYVPWSEENEIRELAACQIGLMPLTADPWSEGKCGFKLIQYLALGIPAVASPVGVNKTIIEHGINGCICDTDEEWYNYIERLLLDAPLRKKMGEEGRSRVEKHYSLRSNARNFLSLFS